MMFDLWPVYSGERFRASWPSCFIRKSIVDTYVAIEVMLIFSSTDSKRAVVSHWRTYGYLILVKRSGEE